jgi:hypothetical protein
MSVIDSKLTDHEREVISMYRDSPRSGIGRAIRLSIQYAIGAGVFLVAAIVTGNPWWSVVVYVVFVAWIVVRLLGARRLAGVMPSVIEKYESRIAELEQQLDDGSTA